LANLFDDANAPETEPATIAVGDQVKWKRTDLGTDYPNTAYSLRYSSRLEGTGSTTFDVASVTGGSAATVNGVFDEGHVTVDVGGQVQVTNVAPQFQCATSDVSSADKGDAITVNSVGLYRGRGSPRRDGCDDAHSGAELIVIFTDRHFDGC
jgi:hypothetical protein